MSFNKTVLLACLTSWGLPAFSRAESSNHDEDLLIAQQIDQLFASSWQSRNIRPAAVSADSEFARRVTLDLTGVIPAVGDAREYAADASKLDRSQLIDQLLASPRFPTHLANLFRDIILPLDTNTEIRRENNGLQRWLRRQFVNDMRYDRIVSDFLSATGTIEDGPAAFYQALEFNPEKLAATTARVFLGMQLECAQCHDHPFDNWKQNDFWGYAAFFAQIQRPNQMAQNFRLVDANQGDVTLPETDEVVAPKYPRGGFAEQADGGSRRIQLSIWMASRDNPFLAKAAVNRVWAMLFGKGLVNPIDDLRPDNPPSHPEVMDLLTKHFVESGFQIKSLIRTIANTKAYQLSSAVPVDANSGSEVQAFERMHVKVLTPDQLFDSLAQALIIPSSTVNEQARTQFVRRMSQSSLDRTQYAAGLQQALNIMNGQQVDGATKGHVGGLLAGLEAPFLNDEDRLNSMFLATVSRFPKDHEKEAFADHLAEKSTPESRKEAVGDIVWALVTCAEFQLNH